MPHRRDIEGLRAIAVLVVLAYHLEIPGFGGGYVGVDVFFVISGFLITSLLVTERIDTQRISLIDFYARRIRRLLPISSVVLAATALTGFMVMDPLRWPDLSREIAAAALWLANAEFASQGTDYLAGAEIPSPVQHYWSLAVEEQFYLIWPMVILLITRGARSVRARVGGAMVLVIAASFSASAVLTPSQPVWSYFGLHTRAFELALGALIATATPLLGRIRPWAITSMVTLGLAGIAISVHAYSASTAFPGTAAALPVGATALVLAAGAASPGPRRSGDPVRRFTPSRILEMQWMQWVGARSYSLYLWHWPVIIYVQILSGHAFPSENWGPVQIATSLAITLCATEIGHRVIENPLRHSPTLRAMPRRSLSLGLGALVLALGPAVLLATARADLTTGVVAAPPPAPVMTAPVTAAPPVSESAPPTTTTSPAATPLPIDMSETPALPAILDAIGVTVLPDNLTPPLREASGDLNTAYNSGCQQYFAVAVRTDCIFGDPEGQRTMALWGDSHAAQWFSALDQIARENHWRLIVLTQGGCPVIDVLTFNRQAGQVFEHCRPWRAAVRDYMRAERVELVIMSQYYALLSTDRETAVPASAWTAHLPELLDSLRADGIEPVLMGDTPDPSEAVPACLAAHRLDISVCSPGQGVRAERLRAVTAAISPVVREREVSFIRPDRWLCAQNTCPTVVGNLLVYRDAHHLSDTIVRWLIPTLREVIAPFLASLHAPETSQLDS